MKLQALNRVIAIGRDTYIRFYPNPGIGLRVGAYRIALSVVGGLEVFKRHPRIVWQRIYAKWSRVQRPGGRV
jgi:hypothetical protein